MRVNARLDETTQQQLEYLTQVTGQSVSHVVRESVAQYYVQVRQQQRPPSKLLAMAGRWRRGHTDSSVRVKEIVAEAIEEKLGLRPPAKKPRAR